MRDENPQDGAYTCIAYDGNEELGRIENARLGNVFEFVNMHEGGLGEYYGTDTTVTRYVIKTDHDEAEKAIVGVHGP
jgi:hypothetical protein